MNKYLSIGELSTYLNLSKSTIYKKTSLNQIPYIKSGKKLLFKESEIDNWLEGFQRPVTSTDDAINILKPLKKQKI